MKGLSYNGYHASVEFDGDDEIFVGRVVGINDVVGFHAETVTALKTAFRDAVDDYLATCASLGRKPEKTYSGSLMVRVDPAVHAQAAKAAELSGKSLAQWAEERLRDAAGRDVGSVGR